MKLYDGAQVVLRNGDKVTIRKNNGGQSKAFPWTAEGGFVPRRSWTDEGRYTLLHPDLDLNKDMWSADHPFDIVSFQSLPGGLSYGSVEQPFSAEAMRNVDMNRFSIKLRNGTLLKGLTRFQGTVFTSQREFVWDAETGQCLVCPDRWTDTITDWDITHLYFELSVKKGQADVSQAGLLKNVETKVQIRHVQPSDESRWSMCDGLREAAKEKGINPATVEAVLRHEMMVMPDGRKVEVGLTQEPEIIHFDDKTGQTITARSTLFDNYAPRKPVVKMAKAMAEALGGKLKAHRWISSSEIEFDVFFENHQILLADQPLQYTKQFRISVSGCDNNASIPAKKIEVR